VIAEHNQLSAADASGLARFGGTQLDVSGGEAVLDPEHLVPTTTVAQALRQAFVRALQSDVFDDGQRQRMAYFIEATSNVEQLMSEYFTLYSSVRPGTRSHFST
jgi:hypothetical protein